MAIKTGEVTIFTFLDNLFYKKDLIYDKKVAPAYLLSLWLSHDSGLINIVNKINELHFNISDDLIYKYYFHKIPRGKRYLKWIKKDEKDKKIKDKIDKFREEYQISKKEAGNYIWYVNKHEFTSNKKSSKIKTKVFFKE